MTRMLFEMEDCVFSTLCLKSLAKCPKGCNNCSINVGWVDGGSLASQVNVGEEHWRRWPPLFESTEAGRDWGALKQ